MQLFNTILILFVIKMHWFCFYLNIFNSYIHQVLNAPLSTKNNELTLYQPFIVFFNLNF